MTGAGSQSWLCLVPGICTVLRVLRILPCVSYCCREIETDHKVGGVARKQGVLQREFGKAVSGTWCFL